MKPFRKAEVSSSSDSSSKASRSSSSVEAGVAGLLPKKDILLVSILWQPMVMTFVPSSVMVRVW